MALPALIELHHRLKQICNVLHHRVLADSKKAAQYENEGLRRPALFLFLSFRIYVLCESASVHNDGLTLFIFHDLELGAPRVSLVKLLQ